IGQYFSKFYPPEDVESGKPERDLGIAASTGRFEDEGWRIRKDGSRFMAIAVLTAVHSPAGALLGFSKVTRDMTERYEAENAQKLLNRELEAFSYSVAHDLRAPLRGMNGFAQVLVDKYGTQLDAQGQDWLQEILLNAKKMGELIDALLSLARLARSELHAERVDLTAVAHEAAAQLAADSPVVVDLVVQDGLVAEVDRALALRIFTNLLGNAFKFTQNTAAPRVEVGTVEHEGAPAFFVRDNGAGFDMAFAGKLFTPFHRLHTVREFPGTGIGLATVQRIVHRHGGRVWAEGRVDGGATFYFTLPRRLSEA
ncbi:MAG: ATP-binding protein, partial [Polyangiaceae bacterium]